MINEKTIENLTEYDIFFIKKGDHVVFNPDMTHPHIRFFVEDKPGASLLPGKMYPIKDITMVSPARILGEDAYKHLSDEKKEEFVKSKNPMLIIKNEQGEESLYAYSLFRKARVEDLCRKSE